jgi:phenylalanyl-tRNA synthetase beta chain
MKESLERLEFGVTLVGEDVWDVAVPTFRRDVTREVDLIEEVIRQRGYDSITSDLPSQAGAGAGRSQIDRRSAMARRALQTAGLNEAINFVMADRADEEPFAVGGTAPLAIENPLQSQAAWLRMSLLPGLLRNVAHNLNHGLSRCHLYEIGAVFLRGPDRLEERRHLAFVLAGQGLPMHWSLRMREVDLYDARGTVELLVEMLGLSPLTLSSDRMPFLVDGRALRIALKGRPIGWTGQIVGGILERFGIDQPVYGCQIDFQDLDREAVGARQYRPLPRYPGVRRDLALIVKQDVPFDAIERVVRSVNTVPIEDVQPFDRYRGPGVPEGCVSVAVQISFRHAERTLTSEEVQAAQDKIVSALERQLGTRLRGPAGS